MSASTKIGSNSAILDTKIDETAAGLQSAVAKRLHSINETNAAIIVDYVASLKSEVNLADHYRRDVIITLCKVSEYSNNNKLFNDLTRTDVLEFLDSHRKNETLDFK